jgi:Ran GTPase-activating protein (RanGAP) involved in mRNA processing and transport
MDAHAADAVSTEGHYAQEVARSPGAGPHENPTRPARHGRKSSKVVMGDPYCARPLFAPARCVSSNGKDEQCWCPLSSVYCARQSHNRDSFFAAIHQNRQDVVNFLLSPQHCEQERITDFREWLLVRESDGRCGLHVAVKLKKHRIIAILLRHIQQELDCSFLLDLSDGEGMNAMLEACQIGSLSTFQMLHNAGASWTVCNCEGKNGRDLALAAGHDNIVEFIDGGQGKGQGAGSGERDPAAEDGDADGSEILEDAGAAAGAAAGEREVQQAEDPLAPLPRENVADEPPEADEQELQDLCDIILMHPAFESFEHSHSRMAARGCVLRRYKRNDVILGPQASAQERAFMLFMLSGEVRVQKEHDNRHDELLEEGDSYGERALLLGEIIALPLRPVSLALALTSFSNNVIASDTLYPAGEQSSDILSANKDCHVMLLSKSVLEPIVLGNPTYAESVGASLAAKFQQDAQHGKMETTSDMHEGEYQYAKELEKQIYAFYEIPVPEVIEEPVDRNRREIEDVPLLDNVKDGLPIKFKHTYELCSDKKVNDRLRRSAAKIDEEDLFQYVEGCHQLGTQPLNSVIFQIRRREKLLDLRGLKITATEALALSSALTLITRPLEGFDLSNNPIFDKGCINSESVRFCGVINSIALNANIKTVILSRTRISHAAAAQFGRIVSYHETLAKLDLSRNYLGDQGVEALAKGLMSSPSVKDLNLSDTKCSFRGATALAAMISSNKTLEIVNLSWNSFLCKGSTALLDSMKAHPKLEEVHIEWNFLGHTGGVALGNVLGASGTIQRIDVSHCQITESATDSICAGLLKNTVLKNMRLQFNPLKMGVPRIKDAMLENKKWGEKMPSINLYHCDFDGTQYYSCVVNATIPTGHYKFDLSKPTDRKGLEFLVNLATKENGENWKNETLNGERFNYPHNISWVPPAKGMLELDFVHMEKSEDDIMSEKNADILLTALNAAVSPEVRLELIKQACMGFRITGDDAMRILYSLNRNAEKEEALIALFSRLCSR